MTHNGNKTYAPTGPYAGASSTSPLGFLGAASLVGLAGLALGTRDRRFLVLTAAAAVFALGRAVRGVRPPSTTGRQVGMAREEVALEADVTGRLADQGARPDTAAASDVALAERYDRYAG